MSRVVFVTFGSVDMLIVQILCCSEQEGFEVFEVVIVVVVAVTIHLPICLCSPGKQRMLTQARAQINANASIQEPLKHVVGEPALGNRVDELPPDVVVSVDEVPLPIKTPGISRMGPMSYHRIHVISCLDPGQSYSLARRAKYPVHNAVYSMSVGSCMDLPSGMRHDVLNTTELLSAGW